MLRVVLCVGGRRAAGGEGRPARPPRCCYYYCCPALTCFLGDDDPPGLLHPEHTHIRDDKCLCIENEATVAIPVFAVRLVLPDLSWASVILLRFLLNTLTLFFFPARGLGQAGGVAWRCFSSVSVSGNVSVERRGQAGVDAAAGTHTYR